MIIGLEYQYMGKLEQQFNTIFHCGNTCLDGGYAYIVAMVMSDTVA